MTGRTTKDALFAFIRRFAGIGLLTACAWPQPPAKPLAFEVASVKPADPHAKRSGLSTRNGNDLIVENWQVRNLIKFAYSLQDFQLSGGPGWIATERFDITAKAPRDESIIAFPTDPRQATDQQLSLRGERLRERVRTLLAERFGLQVHHETREQTIYVLAPGKTTLRLKTVTTPEDRQGIADSGKGRMQGYAATMDALAHVLATVLGRPVLDKTGLTGMYDFTLEWTPDAALDGSESPVSTAGPTLFTALQEQLGLRLDSSKGAVDVMVIDRADQPSAN